MRVLTVCVLLLSLVAPLHAQEPATTIAVPISPSLLRQLLAPAPAVTLPAVDYTPLLQQILASQQQLLEAQAQLLTVEKDTNLQVTAVGKTFGQTMGDVLAFAGKYILPAVGAWIAAKKL